MITIKDIGDFESVPGIVSDIINGDTLALDKHLSEGFDIEEGYLDDYEEILGAIEEEISAFEKKFGISLPEDVKELYRYKNGSKFFSLFPCIIGERDMAFNLMSL